MGKKSENSKKPKLGSQCRNKGTKKKENGKDYDVLVEGKKKTGRSPLKVTEMFSQLKLDRRGNLQSLTPNLDPSPPPPGV